jgi:DNA-binding transcriptional regulator YdaS (Cro superfamily)
MLTVYARTLSRAAQLAGGQEALAQRLDVEETQLALWMNGAAKPPGDVFLKAADIVSEHELRVLSDGSRVD